MEFRRTNGEVHEEDGGPASSPGDGHGPRGLAGTAGAGDRAVCAGGCDRRAGPRADRNDARAGRRQLRRRQPRWRIGDIGRGADCSSQGRWLHARLHRDRSDHDPAASQQATALPSQIVRRDLPDLRSALCDRGDGDQPLQVAARPRRGGEGGTGPAELRRHRHGDGAAFSP